jgi:hypothetical protein
MLNWMLGIHRVSDLVGLLSFVGFAVCWYWLAIRLRTLLPPRFQPLAFSVALTISLGFLILGLSITESFQVAGW